MIELDSALRNSSRKLFLTMEIRRFSLLSPKEMIERVALCGGSGAEFIPEAIRQGADVYITADCKYHEFKDADGQIGLIDIDHWYSERHAREIFKDILDSIGVKCFISTADHSPINILKH